MTRWTFVGLATLAAASVATSAGAAATYPPGFQETVVFSGLTAPTVTRFAPDGRVFVAQKNGLVRVFQSLTDPNPATTYADLRTQVYDFWDRGLLGMVLDPSFATNQYVYVLYTLDKKPGSATIPGWGDVCPDKDGQGNVIGPGATTDGCAASARLSRLQPYSGTPPAGCSIVGTGICEKVLIGYDPSAASPKDAWCQQFPSHSIGTLQFGTDGALYAGAGDAGNFIDPDWGQWGGTRSNGQGGFYTPANVCGDPPGGSGVALAPPTAEGGALRAQSVRRGDGPAVLNGAILRLDPATGLGLPDNPLGNSSDANAKRIVANGLRNPFRFTMRPGTKEIWIGDVGWNTFEEIDRLTDPLAVGPTNFGWPCYEGGDQQSSYRDAGLNLCASLYADHGTSAADAPQDPFYQYYHSEHVVSADACPTGSSSVAGLAFYTGGSYPGVYNGALFFTDYTRRCIYAVMPDGTGTPNAANRLAFGTGLTGGAVNLEIGPGGDVFFTDYDTGTIRRIRYFSGNTPPTAVISTQEPPYGPVVPPLTIHFSASGSTDPDPGDQAALTYEWDLDGNGTYETTGVAAVKTYSVVGPVTVRLRVTDPHGAQGISSIVIYAGNTPPTAAITGPAPFAWKVGDPINFAGSATDAEEGTLPAADLSWTIVLHHCPSNCHEHIIETLPGVAAGSFTAPDHDYPSYLELRLTATDAGGLSSTTSLNLNPQTVLLSFATSPAGLNLAVDASTATAPFSRTVMVGSSNSVSAPSPQTGCYNFVSWSDGGAQSHAVLATAAPAVYTATYVSNQISIQDAAKVAEGNSGTSQTTFPVTLACTSAAPVTVDFATANGTAVAGSDYLAKSGTLTFAANSTTPTSPLTVTVLGDTRHEKNETILVNLTNPNGASLGRHQAQGVIVDDDPGGDLCTPIAVLPFTAGGPGLYCLTRSLSLAATSGDAISVTADGVTIDLKGFTMTNTADAATQTIGVHSINRKNVVVRNGAIEGFFTGVYLAQSQPYSGLQGNQVAAIRVTGSTYTGIRVEGQGNRVSGNQVKATGATTVFGPASDTFGIATDGANALVSGNVVSATAGTGTGTGYGIRLTSADGAQVLGDRVSNAKMANTIGVSVGAGTALAVKTNRFTTVESGIVFDVGASGSHPGNVFVNVPVPYTGP
jgi:glucose/arabinose dehydrogenase